MSLVNEQILIQLSNQIDRNKPIEVINKEKADRNGKVVVFYGGGVRGGVTSVVLHTALEAARSTDLNIGLLDLNLKAPDLADFLIPNLSRGNLNIDNLVPSLAKGSFITTEFQSRLMVDKNHSNLWYLLGTNYPYLFNHYAGIYIDAILEASRCLFDLVLVDVCEYPDNPATISALANSDKIVLVTVPEISALRSWQNWNENLLADLGLENKTIGVLNKADTSVDYTEEHVSRELKIPIVAKLPTAPDLTNARNECLTLDQFNSKAANNYLKEIKVLVTHLKQNEPQEIPVKKSRFSLSKLIGFSGRG